MYDKLTSNNKQKVKDFQYENYVKNTTTTNDIAISCSRVLEQNAEKKGAKVIRLTDTEIMVKGVTIHSGYITEIMTREDYDKDCDENVNEYRALCCNNKKIIETLYLEQQVQPKKKKLLRKKLIIQDLNETITINSKPL
jgi:hypothetical protein